MREKIVQIWRIICGLIGGGIAAAIGFLFSWYQPIEGVPGHELITPDDYSIIFGFLLAAVVFGLVGFVIGYFVGDKIGEGISSKKITEIKEAERKQAYIDEQRTRLRAMFYGIMTDKLFEKKEEVLSTGRVISDHDLSWEAINETTEIVRNHMGFTHEQLSDIMDFDSFVGALASEDYKEKLALKLEKMEKEEEDKQIKEINNAYKKLFLETLKQKKNAARETGQPVNTHALATEAMNETSMEIAEKYSISYQYLADAVDYAAVIAQYGSG